jgi:hypothetical protein
LLTSPAFGEIDGYGVSLHVSIPEALKLWGFPVSEEDISKIFQKYVTGEIDAIPWSEEGLNPETSTITDELLKLNAKGWWTVASQPALNGIKSNDEVFGWGPRNGFVFQKVCRSQLLSVDYMTSSLTRPTSPLSSSSSVLPTGNSSRRHSKNILK